MAETTHHAERSVRREDINYATLDAAGRRAHGDLFNGLIDIYKITGTEATDDTSTIKRKCAKLLTKYHSSKVNRLLIDVPEAHRDRKRREYAAHHELIHQAYKILIDPKRKEYYDLQRRIERDNDFVSQRNEFDEFVRLQDASRTAESEARAKQDFELKSIELDRRRGVDRKQMEEAAPDARVMGRRADDLSIARDAQTEELKPRNMFDGRSFNLEDFNKAFEKQKRKEDKKRGVLGPARDTTIVEWEGIQAADDFGDFGNTFVATDANYEDLFDERDTGRDTHIHAGVERLSDVASDDIGSVHSDEIDVSYVNGHSKNNDDVMAQFASLRDQYEYDRKLLDQRRFTREEDWKSVFDNPMNISAQMGEGRLVGDRPVAISSFIDRSQHRHEEVDEDLINAYSAIMRS